MALWDPEYRNGGEGMIKWVEDMVCMPIYPAGSSIPTWVPMNDLPKKRVPETGRSYYDMWQYQKEVLVECLQMKNAKFKYRLIVFCWMRGEGKTAIGPVLINLWKFFCWPKQTIVLGANSKDQTKFVTFDQMTAVVQNSHQLLKLLGGPDNILPGNQELRLRDSHNNIVSKIKAITTAQGILSNITGYSFSEMFQMKRQELFSQLDGSMRNVPNALGVIDSTVSAKDHLLYRLYKTWIKGNDPHLYFSYRCSREAKSSDFWHPLMTPDQLKSYKAKDIDGSFDRYFRNVWGVSKDRYFDEELVDAIYYIGAKSRPGDHEALLRNIRWRNKIRDNIDSFSGRGNPATRGLAIKESKRERLEMIEADMVPFDSLARYHEEDGISMMMPASSLDDVGQYYDTDWVIIGGLDRSDPLRKGKRTNARTVMTFLAKGLPGSKKNPDMWRYGTTDYLYVIVWAHTMVAETGSHIKESLSAVHEEYGGIDMFCAERYGMFDILEWCGDNDIPCDHVHPTYKMQHVAFSELHRIMKAGGLKAARFRVPGSKGPDIVEEELKHLDHLDKGDNRGWFGSSEKGQTHGIQDDFCFALVWGIFGGRKLVPDDFRPIGGKPFLGMSIQDKSLYGKYA